MEQKMKTKNSKKRYFDKQTIKKLILIIIHIILWILIKSNPSIDQHVDLGWFDPAFDLLELLIDWILKKNK